MGDVDYTMLRFVLDLIQIGGVVGLGIYTWFVNRTKSNRQDINALHARLQQVERNHDVLQSQVEHAPTHYDLGKVYEQLNGVANTLSELTGQLGAVNHQLSMVHEYLLNSKREGGGR